MFAFAKSKNDVKGSGVLTQEDKSVIFGNSLDLNTATNTHTSEQIENSGFLDNCLKSKNESLLLFQKFYKNAFLLKSTSFVIFVSFLFFTFSSSAFLALLVFVLMMLVVMICSSSYEAFIESNYNSTLFSLDVLLRYVSLYEEVSDSHDYKSTQSKKIEDFLELLKILTNNKDIKEDSQMLNDFLLRKMKDGHSAEVVLEQMCFYYLSIFLEKNAGSYPGIEDISKNFNKLVKDNKKEFLT